MVKKILIDKYFRRSNYCIDALHLQLLQQWKLKKVT